METSDSAAIRRDGDLFVQKIDGLSVRLREPFSLGFLRKFGTVFHVFDDQDSGNLCFGMEKEGARYFVKFAGAPTARGSTSPEQAVERLRSAVPVYRDLQHENLIELTWAGEIGGGYAAVFRWADGDCMGRMYPEAHRRFFMLPVCNRLSVYDAILRFLEHTAACGYVAVDFYDGSVLHDASTGKTTICDVDFFRRLPCVNDMGRMWGSSLFQSPEEYRLGAAIDELTNVYTAGAFAFALFGGYQRGRESWELSDGLYHVAFRAVNADRARRQPSLRALREEWETALAYRAK